MFKEITFEAYLQLFTVAKNLDKKIEINVSTPENEEGKRYFKSLEGCSALSSNGELCGLFRFKKGVEKVAKLHQKKRIELGGYWLNCYKGKLNEIYKKNGFFEISALNFNPEFAPKDWKKDNVLKNQPLILFMSLYPSNEFQISRDWFNAELICKNTKFD